MISLSSSQQTSWVNNLWVEGDGFTFPFKFASHTLFANWFPTDVIATTSSDLQHTTSRKLQRNVMQSGVHNAVAL